MTLIPAACANCFVSLANRAEGFGLNIALQGQGRIGIANRLLREHDYRSILDSLLVRKNKMFESRAALYGGVMVGRSGSRRGRNGMLAPLQTQQTSNLAVPRARTNASTPRLTQMARSQGAWAETLAPFPVERYEAPRRWTITHSCTLPVGARPDFDPIAELDRRVYPFPNLQRARHSEHHAPSMTKTGTFPILHFHWSGVLCCSPADELYVYKNGQWPRSVPMYSAIS